MDLVLEDLVHGAVKVQRIVFIESDSLFLNLDKSGKLYIRPGLPQSDLRNHPSPLYKTI